ncbi:MAG: hypothetical protein EPN17_08105 [Methylobacter sp.]|nr:MAG: hypothetical protein EPN17_08105 [Methylobacter sp.]
MKNHKRIIALAVGATLMAGCASFASQSDWPVAIKSTPGGAVFTVTNKKGEKIHTGTTPSTVYLAGGAGFFDDETYTLHFTKNGFQEKTATLDTSLSPWYWGNLVSWGPLGFLIIDPATGAMFRLPETFSADLTAQVSSKAASPDALKVISLNDVPQELRSQLIRVEQ